MPSTRRAAHSVMRRPPQLGQKPRPLQEKGTSRSKAQSLTAEPRKAMRQHAAREEISELLLHELRHPVAIGVMRRRVEERLQMLIDHAVQHAVVGSARLIPGNTVGHADDVGAVSGRRQCRESGTRHAWGWEGERRRPGGCLFPGTPGAGGCGGPFRGPPRQNDSGSVTRTQRPPLTTARNDEFAPWCLSGPKLASGPLKMSR